MTNSHNHGPKGWTTITLEQNSADEYIKQVDSGGTPDTTNAEYWDGEIPWLTPKEITDRVDSIFVSQTERCITASGLKASSAKILPVNTVMLTKRAPVGAVAINAIPMATNQGFLSFTCGAKLKPLYLAYWLKANRLYLDMIANGSTYPEIYKGDLFEFTFLVPPIETQDSIIGVIGALQYVTLLGLPLEQSVLSPQQMLKVQAQNRRLREIRSHLVPLLLSGELDVSRIRTIFLKESSDVTYNNSQPLQHQFLPPSLWTQRKS